MTNDELQTLLNESCAKLGEHFSSVLILASIADTDKEGHYTDGFKAGTGDFYSRRGLAQVYLEKEWAQMIARSLKEIK